MIKERRYYFRKSVDSESVLCYNKARVKRQIMFPLPFIFIRPWRSWISQQIPILKAGGSNPSGRANLKRPIIRMNAGFLAFSFCLKKAFWCLFGVYRFKNTRKAGGFTRFTGG